MELLGDVVSNPSIRGRGGGEHRDAAGECFHEPADPSVVRPEIVPPIRYAVRLVDHDQPGRSGKSGQHLVAELRVVQPFRTDEQHVHGAGPDAGVDLLPLLGIRRVDRARADAGPAGGFNLVAHQREQRRDDDRRPGALGAQEGGRDEIHRRLAPSGALHHENAAPVCDQGADRAPLVLAQSRLLPGQRPQVALRLEAQRRLVDASIARCRLGHVVHALRNCHHVRFSTLFDRTARRAATSGTL